MFRLWLTVLACLPACVTIKIIMGVLAILVNKKTRLGLKGLPRIICHGSKIMMNIACSLVYSLLTLKNFSVKLSAVERLFLVIPAAAASIFLYHVRIKKTSLNSIHCFQPQKKLVATYLRHYNFASTRIPITYPWFEIEGVDQKLISQLLGRSDETTFGR